jgi:N-carbamoylputrescine amidase
MTSSQLPIALVQATYHNQNGNHLMHIVEQIKQAAHTGAKLIVLPELHNTLYFCQTEDPTNHDLAEPLHGQTVSTLSNLAKQLAVVIVGSIYERRAAGLYHNTAVVLDQDGSLAGYYRKMHIPDDPNYYEKFYFTSGDTGFTPIRTSIGQLGVLVCWDQWFPEAARLIALAGAEILIYPTAIGWLADETTTARQRSHDAWITIQRGHAIANGLPLLTCNRVGRETAATGEQSIHFWGTSFACGPQGEMLAQANTEHTCLLTATIDLAASEQVRRWWPFLRDRRIDAYQDLCKRFVD